MSTKGRILIIDDNQVNVDIMSKILCKEYEIETAETGEEGLEKFPEFKPDVVLLDIMMPGIDGYEVCQRIKSSDAGDYTQVVLVSGKASSAERVRGYEAKADDYIVKPFNHDELLSKVRVHCRLREAQLKLITANDTLENYNSELEQRIEERTQEVLSARDLTVFAIAKLAESRDTDTGEHLVRMRSYAQILAEEIGSQGPYADQIDKEFLENLYRASPLHDVGKVGTPDSILQKPGHLTAAEFDLMKQHVIIGAETLEEAIYGTRSGQFLTMAAEVARYHHERFDGTGYCAGLKGTEIPLSARIVALADVYDALTSKRVYKPSFDSEKSRKIIESESGAHFDPVIVDAFLARYTDFLEVQGVAHIEQPGERPDIETEIALTVGIY